MALDAAAIMLLNNDMFIRLCHCLGKAHLGKGEGYETDDGQFGRLFCVGDGYSRGGGTGDLVVRWEREDDVVMSH